ncbi:phosphopantetheine-binding protein [Streptomyces sp. NPDC057580]|uniref:phosphopantetheine-binding protein n=1 Tax=Streptomyces sp. NPDC057580 TaxID=3346173 RepID=UPI0036990869
MTDLSHTDDEYILTTIRRRAAEVVPTTGDGAPLSADSSLAAAGCNSIDRAEILALVMEDLGVVVPLDEFERSLTLGQVAALMRKHR